MIKTDLGSLAKQKLAEYTPQVFEQLNKYYEQEKKSGFGFNDKQKQLVLEMLEHSREFNTRNSKTLRGFFVRYGYLLGGGETSEGLAKAEMAVQIVHGAILMHDDLMDEDEMRRGKPTSHKYWEGKEWGNKHYGESMALAVGDGNLMMGIQLLLDSGFEKDRVMAALRQFLRGITNTANGQAYDVTLERLQQWSEQDVIDLHKAKTAIYTYENPLFIGAHLAGLPDEAFKILHEYAMDGGVAFQLQDDILGVFGNEDKTGKSADSDLKEGKCTVLIRKVFDIGSNEQIDIVRKVWGDRKAATKDVEAAKKAIKESGSYEYNKKLAKDFAIKAVEKAGKLRKLKLNQQAVDCIQGIGEYMVTREV